MEYSSAEEMENVDTQRDMRLFAQKHLDTLTEKGIFIEKIKLCGAWHSVHNGKILKAPIPENIT